MALPFSGKLEVIRSAKRKKTITVMVRSSKSESSPPQIPLSMRSEGYWKRAGIGLKSDCGSHRLIPRRANTGRIQHSGCMGSRLQWNTNIRPGIGVARTATTDSTSQVQTFHHP